MLFHFLSLFLSVKIDRIIDIVAMDLPADLPPGATGSCCAGKPLTMLRESVEMWPKAAVTARRAVGRSLNHVVDRGVLEYRSK